jgi:hypothetical protein
MSHAIAGVIKKAALYPLDQRREMWFPRCWDKRYWDKRYWDKMCSLAVNVLG